MRHRRYPDAQDWKAGQSMPISILFSLSLTIVQIVELLSNLTKAVQKNEPDVFSFHLYKDFDQETGKEQLVLVEKYANKAAYDYHAELPEFQAMHKSFNEEELMEKPIIIKSVKPVTGFYR
ncbi:hypothetical protein SLS59_004537 [Nothophoma quercina]|uniref:ABM domain-containing protein n=1 Tax=Nothophoma quercina TaxID=749835 RepID=A0ABR3REU7_9PLEO